METGKTASKKLSARRPLFSCCMAFVLVQLAFAYLPQAVFWPLAAFCVAGGLFWAARGRRLLPAAVAAAVALGLFSCLYSAQFLQTRAASLWGAEAILEAEVRQVGGGYTGETVSAVLDVTAVAGRPVRFAVYCPDLPFCREGDRITGRFALDPLPQSGGAASHRAEGVFTQAGFENSFTSLGESKSPRAVLRRLGLRLSFCIRSVLPSREGGILSAMTTGDRAGLTEASRSLYRKAGVTHLLVVSGLHVTLLCGVPGRKGRTRRRKVLAALRTMAAACLVAGVTGMGVSVLRAALTVCLAQLAVLLFAPADGLTALGVAAVLLTMGNCYAVTGLSFQLSFAATLGVLAGDAAWRLVFHRRFDPLSVYTGRRQRDSLPMAVWLWFSENLSVSAGAALFTFPVLVFHGLNASPVSLVSNLLVCVAGGPLLRLGLLTGLCGLVPFSLFYGLQRGCALLAFLVLRALNTALGFLGGLPGAQLCFETPYAGVALLVLAGAGYALWHLGCPRRRIAAGVAVLLAVSVAVGQVASANIVRAALVGNAWTPAVVVTAQGSAAVLFRGGAYNANAVTAFLEQRGIGEPELVIDLRTVDSACPLQGGKTIRLAEQPARTVETVTWRGVVFQLYAAGGGGAVWMDLGGVSAALAAGGSGPPGEVAVDVLLGGPAGMGKLRPQYALALSRRYSWLDKLPADAVYYGQSGLALAVRPGAGWRVWNAETQ